MKNKKILQIIFALVLMFNVNKVYAAVPEISFVEDQNYYSDYEGAIKTWWFFDLNYVYGLQEDFTIYYKVDDGEFTKLTTVKYDEEEENFISLSNYINLVELNSEGDAEVKVTLYAENSDGKSEEITTDVLLFTYYPTIEEQYGINITLSDFIYTSEVSIELITDQDVINQFTGYDIIELYKISYLYNDESTESIYEKYELHNINLSLHIHIDETDEIIELMDENGISSSDATDENGVMHAFDLNYNRIVDSGYLLTEFVYTELDDYIFSDGYVYILYGLSNVDADDSSEATGTQIDSQVEEEDDEVADEEVADEETNSDNPQTGNAAINISLCICVGAISMIFYKVIKKKDLLRNL